MTEKQFSNKKIKRKVKAIEETLVHAALSAVYLSCAHSPNHAISNLKGKTESYH